MKVWEGVETVIADRVKELSVLGSQAMKHLPST